MTAPVEAHLADLVGFPTVSDRPVDGILSWLAERFEGLGFRIERLDSPSPGKANLVCTAGPPGTDGVLLSGHMDVVPVDGQPWTSDPFKLTRVGQRLVGRGACDMKAFLAATLAAAAQLPIRELRKELMLVFTHDEEVGCLGSAQLVRRFLAEGRPVPSATLIGEPTSFQIFRMHPGHVVVQIVCRGRAAHSSKPDLGDNAIRLALRVVERLEAIAERWRTDIRFPELLERPFVVMNIARIAGGGAINIVPDRCVIDLGFRPLPGMAVAALFDEIRADVEALGEVTASLGRVTPALLTPDGTELQGLLRAFAVDPSARAAAYATDGGNLQELGTNTLIFGPGSIDVAHRADEYVPVEELFRCVDVVGAVVWGRCA